MASTSLGHCKVLTSRDTLDTTTTCETTDGGLSDTLDVVTKNLSVTLRTTLSEAFATFAAYRYALVVVQIKCD